MIGTPKKVSPILGNPHITLTATQESGGLLAEMSLETDIGQVKAGGGRVKGLGVLGVRVQGFRV